MRCALMNTPHVLTRPNKVPSILSPFNHNNNSFVRSFIFLIVYKTEATKGTIHVVTDCCAVLCPALCPASDVEK